MKKKLQYFHLYEHYYDGKPYIYEISAGTDGKTDTFRTTGKVKQVEGLLPLIGRMCALEKWGGVWKRKDALILEGFTADITYRFLYEEIRHVSFNECFPREFAELHHLLSGLAGRSEDTISLSPPSREGQRRSGRK